RPRPMISCGTRSTVRSRFSAEAIRDVPGRASAVTSANYQVLSYKPDEYFNSRNRRHYFAEISTVANQVIFFDPDNAFEPEKSCETQHLNYQELQDVLERLSPHSVVTVFQYFRRMPFPADFARIRERLLGGLATAIYWQALMFVGLSRSPELIG